MVDVNEDDNDNSHFLGGDSIDVSIPHICYDFLFKPGIVGNGTYTEDYPIWFESLYSVNTWSDQHI